jgi:antitoxin component HigA of HigAB toxin-antitoxin module
MMPSLFIEAIRTASYTRVRNGEGSVRALASRIGYSQHFLHNVFHGRRALSIDMAESLVIALHLSDEEIGTAAAAVSAHGQIRTHDLTGARLAV